MPAAAAPAGTMRSVPATGLPEDLTVTRGPVEDYDELAVFVRSVNVAQSGSPGISREQLESMLTMPDVDQEEDIRLVRDADGSLVAAGWVQNRAPHIETFARGMVTPRRTGEGIGSHILEWELDVARRRVELAPDGARVAVKAGIDPGHEPSVALVTDHGFSLERYFLEMKIDFDEAPLTPAPLPDGFRLLGFDPDGDLDRLFDVIDEAFRDHYGYVERPREEELTRFRRFMDTPRFDPSLVWMVAEGDEVVGSCVCIGEHEGETDVGYVGNIAVRRPWRGRGLAKAMMTVAFAEFARRGKSAAALHVDAENATGATRLYESVGMREISRDAVYQRELRPGKKLSVG